MAFTPLNALNAFLVVARRRSFAQAARDLGVSTSALSQARTANQALVDQVAALATARGVTPAQIALAWLLARRPFIVPIPGTTKPHRLLENVGAAAVELTPGDLARIEAALAGITVHGDRYPAHLAARTGR